MKIILIKRVFHICFREMHKNHDALQYFNKKTILAGYSSCSFYFLACFSKRQYFFSIGKMVFLVITHFALFSCLSIFFGLFVLRKLYYYFKKKGHVKELANYVKYLHWQRLENIKRIKHSIKVTYILVSKKPFDHIIL